jgi:histidinol-phosphate aminotransferase
MREDLLALEPYTIPDIASMERRLGRPVVKLDANENPYGPSPLAAEALRTCSLERYPDPDWNELRCLIGEYLQVDPEGVICSAGGDEMLDLLGRLFLAAGDEVIDCPPSFVMYPEVAAFHRARYVAVPRDDEFRIDAGAVEAAVSSRTKLIFVCTPNNPTGNLTPESDIRRLLDTGRMVILDEAYAEFAGYTLVQLTKTYDNLIVLRTMSKWGALAGIRLGYAIAHPDVRREMGKIKSPYNVGIAAQVAAVASFRDRATLDANARKIVAERERLSRLLQELPVGRVHPSQANFLYWTTEGASALVWRDALFERGVLVRSFSDDKALRITVGMPHETDVLIQAMKRELVESPEKYMDLAS